MSPFGHLVGLFLLIAIVPSWVNSYEGKSRSVYTFPALDDECIDECGKAGQCLTVKRYVRKCSPNPYTSFSGKKCITPCTNDPSDGNNYKCQINGQAIEYCSLVKRRNRIRYFGATLIYDKPQICLSSCNKFSGTNYNWCRTNTGTNDWDYCSLRRKSPIESRWPLMRIEESTYGNLCLDQCRNNYGNDYTYCNIDAVGAWDKCGNSEDKTVSAYITYTYSSGRKLLSVSLDHDARERINGQPIDVFWVVNTTQFPGENHEIQRSREKRDVCRGTCLSQTLDSTLTNVRDELMFLIDHNIYPLERYNPPGWTPYAPDGGGATVEIRNSVQEVIYRYIDPARQVTRVEYLHAEIHPGQYFQNQRLDFHRSDLQFMRRQPNVTAEHEGGHLIASALGGPPERWNLVPQHRSVNRNYNAAAAVPTYENDWYSVENYMNQFFADGQPGHNGGYINWRVAVTYETNQDYVPHMFQYLATFYDDQHNEIDDGYWFPMGGAMLNDDSPPHHD